MTSWLTAIAILVSGLTIGWVFVFGIRRRPAVALDRERRLELERERDLLIAQLRALDEGESTERAHLEAEAARVLRALDASPRPPEVVVLQPASVGHSVSGLRGFLWGSGTIATIAFVGWFVMHSAVPKENPVADPPRQAPAAQLDAAVLKNPDDLNARIELARVCLDRGDLMAVFEHTKFVLERNPNEARAQTYQAIVRAAMGQRDQAQALIESAVQNDPRFTEAWITLAWLRSQDADRDGAARAIESAIRQHPEDEKHLRGVLAQMLSSPVAVAVRN